MIIIFQYVHHITITQFTLKALQQYYEIKNKLSTTYFFTLKTIRKYFVSFSQSFKNYLFLQNNEAN